MNDEIGTRMKDFYEGRSQSYLSRKVPVIIRVDGKAFHTFTKGMEKPFDNILIQTMQETAVELCKNIQGAKIAYVQSDEISILLTDYENFKTDAWFDYNIQKITSVSASIATMAFNKFFMLNVNESGLYTNKLNQAIFDSRCFSIPKEEVCNYFYWRQIDAIRNSIQMVAQSNFSHKELQNKNTSILRDDLLKQKGIDFSGLKTHLQRGTCIIKQLDFDGRSRWIIDNNIPIFKNEGRFYVERYV